MAVAAYRVIAAREGWAVEHDGEQSGGYKTKEAAFEATIGPASNAIRAGHAVTITVEGSSKDEPNLGAR